jgi:amino acid transporter
MIGSGLFVLPGLAAGKAEMATAMPESGGTYLYIDRAMGPLMGTISGLGAWFSLVFKSAFALVGLGAYFVVVLPLPAAQLTLVSLGLAGILVAINILGVKQSGQFQAFLVSFVLLAFSSLGPKESFSLSLGSSSPFPRKAPEGSWPRRASSSSPTRG